MCCYPLAHKRRQAGPVRRGGAIVRTMGSNRALWASWIGIAMACLAGASRLLIALYPERRSLLLFLTAVFLSGALLAFIEAARAWRAKSPTPRIVLGPQAFHVKRVGWRTRLNAFETDVLGVILINDPSVRSASAAAKGLGVKFMCEEIGSGWINARLDYSPQPRPGEEVVPLRFDLDIDEWREFSFVVKETESSDCFLFNNDSYSHPRIQLPKWRLGEGEHKLLVRVDGVEVKERFECTFINPGAGHSLEVKSFTPPSPPVPAPP